MRYTKVSVLRIFINDERPISSGMPKSLVLGNGNILVAFDRFGQITDFFFPQLGVENQVSGETPTTQKMGVWADRKFHWFDDGTWKIAIDCAPDTHANAVTAENNDLGVVVRFNDVVYNEKNILVREITVENTFAREREIKIFFRAVFELYASHRQDTAYYDPNVHAIVHYEGRRVMLVNARTEEKPFDQYSIGLYELEGREGTWRDAEDGILSANPIEHGKVDSVIGMTFALKEHEKKTMYYWIAAAETQKESYALNSYVIEHSPAHLLKTTRDFWRAWLNRRTFTFYGLDEPIVNLFKKSLLIIRAHADNGGAIIASCDSDMLHHGRDTYAYMWPRDGAVAALALDNAGDEHVAQRFFEFMRNALHDDGYFMHKYRADGSIGSSWHPWVHNGMPILPIQEDGTALVLWALWEHYRIGKDLEFIEGLYNPLIKRVADFLVSFVDNETALPKPSYDLWEEKFGVSTYTASTVFGALSAASRFADLLGKSASADVYKATAAQMKDAIVGTFYDSERRIFNKMFIMENGARRWDTTLDASSAYGVFKFGVLPPDDERLVAAMEATEKLLCCKTSADGMPRYERDGYYGWFSTLENPWFITTLWLAQYHIARAQSEKDMGEAKRWLEWTAKHATPSGILSEQLNPGTGEQISAAPLVWSHAEFILTVVQYLEKLESLGVCVSCAPIHEISA